MRKVTAQANKLVKKILFFDDVEGRAQRWAADLSKLTYVKKNFDIRSMPMDEFRQAIQVLNERRRKAREVKKKHETDWNHDLDQTAILIIDFDLFEFNPDITAESVAYLARCYSRCGLIVALNQFDRSKTFDLTLRGHPESFADLNLHEFYIHNPGLWREPWEGFRPWVWPLLPRALEAYETRIGEVRSALNKPILSFLGLDRIAQLLPRSTLEFIESKGKPEKTTFRQFVKESQQGLRARDYPADEESVARIAAARIYKWLERLVLPGQDVLVDAPHLVSRFPSLLKGDLEDEETWQRVAAFELPSKGGIRTNLIKRFRFAKESWASRPCWFWGELSSYEEITEVKDPWKTVKKADVVFSEDISAFVLRSEAKEFVADLPSPFVRRYVHDEAGIDIDYQPNVRFTF